MGSNHIRVLNFVIKIAEEATRFGPGGIILEGVQINTVPHSPENEPDQVGNSDKLHVPESVLYEVGVNHLSLKARHWLNVFNRGPKIFIMRQTVLIGGYLRKTKRLHLLEIESGEIKRFMLLLR